MKQVVDQLVGPEGFRVAHIPLFIHPREIDGAQEELERANWLDAHKTFINESGRTIIQNHNTYAFDFVRGEQGWRHNHPATLQITDRVTRYVRALGSGLPNLKSWTPTEGSYHQYDDQEIGLSHHRDQSDFIGVVAVASIDGESDLSIIHEDVEYRIETKPRGLILLRAPKLVNENDNERPFHAVLNLRTPTRTSFMLRQNKNPHKPILGFHFNNVAADDAPPRRGRANI